MGRTNTSGPIRGGDQTESARDVSYLIRAPSYITSQCVLLEI